MSEVSLASLCSKPAFPSVPPPRLRTYCPQCYPRCPRAAPDPSPCRPQHCLASAHTASTMPVLHAAEKCPSLGLLGFSSIVLVLWMTDALTLSNLKGKKDFFSGYSSKVGCITSRKSRRKEKGYTHSQEQRAMDALMPSVRSTLS